MRNPDLYSQATMTPEMQAYITMMQEVGDLIFLTEGLVRLPFAVAAMARSAAARGLVTSRGIAIAPRGSGFLRDPRSLAEFTLAERLDMRMRHQALVLMLERGEDVAMRTGSMSAQLMGDLTVATGREVALIRIGNQRFLRLGGADSAFVGDATRLIAHTHPSGVLRFSTGAESDITVFTEILRSSPFNMSPLVLNL
jgi:hypothetical protein